MKLHFLGASGQVTGSCYLLEVGSYKILLDCGLFQGSRDIEQQNDLEFPFNPSQINAVILSHTHLDHCGRLPLLVKQKFRSPLYLTDASYPMLELMLRDSAHIQLKDTEWENKNRQRAGKPPIEPLYDMEDVEALLMLRASVHYQESKEILPGITLTFYNSGHILGSAIVQLAIKEGSQKKILVFSGDLGNNHSPLLPDPDTLNHADILLMESTYGDRDHKPLQNTLTELENALKAADDSGGNVIIPAFAVGRSQDLIYWLGKLQRQGRLPQRHIYLDSPMAIRASEIYAQHNDQFNHDDPEFNQVAKQGWQAWLEGLVYSQTAEDSMAINRISGGAIIIAGSGMCNGGRVRHHLKYNLWRRNTHVIIAGFQAQGTLGRILVEGQKKTIKILGSEINIAAKIHTLGALSAHADQSQLLQWVGHFQDPKPRLYLVHGEKTAALSLQTSLGRRNWHATIPQIGDAVVL